MKKKIEMLYSSNHTNSDFLVLSCIGIIMVVASHCNCNFADFDSFVPYFNFHVPLFVFIAGYFFNSDRTIKNWLLHKLKKLIIPYYIVNTIFRIMGYFLHRYFGFWVSTEISFRSIILEPLYPKNLSEFNSAAWFLMDLFYIELFYMLMMKIIKTKNKQILIAIINLLAGLVFIKLSIDQVWIQNGSKNILLMNIFRSFALLPFISFGTLYRKYIENKTKMGKTAIIAIAFGVLVITYNFFPDYLGDTTIDYKQCSYSYLMPTYIVGVCGITIWLQISKCLSGTLGNAKIIKLIGSNTFSIMSYHFLGFFLLNCIIYIINPYIHFFEEIDISILLQKPRYIIYGSETNNWLYLVFSIAISLFIKWIIEETKYCYQKLSSRIKTRR